MKRVLCVCIIALLTMTGVTPHRSFKSETIPKFSSVIGGGISVGTIKAASAETTKFAKLNKAVEHIISAGIVGDLSSVSTSTTLTISTTPTVAATTATASYTPILKNATIVKAPVVAAASVLLLDAKSGTVLWRKNANQQQHMASTTKIMTAIIALENSNLDETVTVHRDAVIAGKEGGIKLAENEKIKLRDLMYALLLPSANDAAVAIADHVAGSEAAFAVMMNRKASKLGAKRTHFVNSHGLDHKLHYSTVGDLSLFARHAMGNPEFSKIVSTKKWVLTRCNPKLPSKMENTNTLLTSYSGTYGIKTGYTRKARNCMVTGAIRGDVSLMCVVLGAKHRKDLFRESAALLDFGFKLINN